MGKESESLQVSYHASRRCDCRFPQRCLARSATDHASSLSPTRTGGIGTANVEIYRSGETRYDDFYQLDMRVEKQFTFGKTKWAAAFDVFDTEPL